MTSSVNGRTGEMVRWVVAMVAAIVVSYFTAMGALQSRVSVVEEREQNHFHELQRRLGAIEGKLDAALNGVR